MREGVLIGNGHGVMDKRLDAAGGKMRLELVASAAADDKQMIHVSGIALRRDVHWRMRQQLPIEARERAASRRHRRQAGQLRAEDRGLQFVETRVHAAAPVMMVAIGLAAVAKLTQIATAVESGD